MDDIKNNAGATNRAGTYSEHLMSIDELADYFKTKLNSKDVTRSIGLKSIEATQRLLDDGLNSLTPPKKISLLERLIRMIFLDAFMAMLLGASILTFVTFVLDPSEKTNLFLSIVLLLIITLNTILTLYQEGKASDVMSSFEDLLPTASLVLRNGVKTRILSANIVVGDVVILETGTKVPADVRILSSSALKVDNSSLTGEFLPVALIVEADSQEPLEARNIAFSGTLVVEGTGAGVAIRTGDRTYVGSIAALASQTGAESSTLTKEIDAFVRFVGIVAFVSGAILFGVNILREGTSSQAIIDGIVNTFIVVIVANVPQGLPSAVTGCLTVAAVNLAARNVYIKSLNSIETLGSVSVVATDKTGTLTMNQMTVTAVWINGKNQPMHNLTRTDDEYDPMTLMNPLSDALSGILFVSAVCNQASIAVKQELSVVIEGEHALEPSELSYGISRRPTATSILYSGRDPPGAALSVTSLVPAIAHRIPIKPKELTGNASDAALYVFADTVGDSSVQTVRDQWRPIFTVPFNSARKWMASVVAPVGVVGVTNRILCVKGAIERILPRCNRLLIDGHVVPITDAAMASFDKTISRYMKEGRRVLAMAGRHLPADEFPINVDAGNEKSRLSALFEDRRLVIEPEDMTATNGLVLLGCAALEDPPKPSVPGAVLKCREAGIKVVMVTGDHPETACAIAKQCNIMGLYKTKEDVQRARSELDVLAKVDDDDSDIGGVVVTGRELSSFIDADWDRVLSKAEIVFARTSPLDKLEIVSRLQARGDIVAVTGDGVNDSPALKRADVGVAMGVCGSDVAKDAGDIILMDDEFMSLVAGIEQGRIIFDNLTKLVAYTLTHLPPELFAVIIGLGLGAPFGMTSMMILGIDLLTEMGPALSLAYEPAEDLVMVRPPRDLSKDRLVSKTLLSYAYLIAGIVEAIVCTFAYMAVFVHNDVRLGDLINTKNFKDGASPYRSTQGEIYDEARQLNIVANAQTAYFCTLVLSQFWHVWMCKTRVISVWNHGLFGNVVMDLGVLVSIGSMLVMTYVPALNTIMGTAIQDQFWFFIPALISLSVLWGWNEGRKLHFRQSPKSRFTKLFGW